MKNLILVYILDSTEYSFEKIYRWSGEELEEMHSKNPDIVKKMTLAEFEEKLNSDDVEDIYCERIRIIVPKLNQTESSVIESLANQLTERDLMVEGEDEVDEDFQKFYTRYDELVKITGRTPQKYPVYGATKDNTRFL